MRTSHVDILLPDYVQGTLGKDDIAVVEEHVRQCAACRSELDEVRQAFLVIGRSEPEDVPMSYFSSILPRVRQRIDRRSEKVWNKKPLITSVVLPAGAAVVLIALLWLVPFRHGATNTRNPLQAVVDSASSEDLAEILQQDIPSHEWSSFSDTVISHALANELFVKKELVQEALTSETTSPFDVLADVSPQQALGGFDEHQTDEMLQQLKSMETL